ncbi:MAG: SPOR domain-containing protein, partial [Deltaproteobacteria bacterium]|nr:SPOR domain-containing protein [Deltaproteobacteria bacterium]
LEDIVETLKKDSEPLTPDILYTVQLASLGNRDKAEKMINGLIEQGYDAYYYEAEVKDKTYFRIRCGRFTTRNEANAYARILAEEGGVKGFVSRLE